MRGIQGGACAPLTSGYLHQIRRYLASKYRACQTLLVRSRHTSKYLYQALICVLRRFKRLSI
ncbi:hypothetical protein CKY07_14520 [Enterococcus faecium]|nr:hypothetical protein CKY07_14520 [Enterococcus faecium]